MTVKTFERTNPDAKNFNDYPSPRKVVKDLFNGDMYEFVDYVDKDVTYVFNILNFNFSITMDFKTAGEYRMYIIQALLYKNYYQLTILLDDYVSWCGDTIRCNICQTIKDNKKLKNIDYNTVEEKREALHLLYTALYETGSL